MDFPTVNQGHIVPAGSLRAWAINKQIAVRRPGDPAIYPNNPRRAGTRGPFYRRHRPDSTQVDDVEWSLSQAESRSLPIMREIEQRWPLSREDKGVLGQFIALQLVRGPGFYDWLSGFRGEEFARMRAAEGAKSEPNIPTLEATQDFLATETQAHVRMISLVPKIGTLFGSTYWALMRFERPLIAISDHPVVVWPLNATSLPHDQELSIEGQQNSLEVRYPVSPHLALVMSWLDEPNEEEPVIGGNRQQACNLNTLTIAQTDEQWFHMLGTSPPTTTGHLLPLSPQIHPGYSAVAARSSARRRAAVELVQPLMGENFPTSAPIVTISRTPA